MTDTEMIAALQAEWKKLFDEYKTAILSDVSAQIEAKGAAFREIDTKITAAVAASTEAIETKFSEKHRRFAEQNSRFPLGTESAAQKSLGSSFTDSNEYKLAVSDRVHARNDHFGTSFKARLVPERKATITEAGSGFALFPQRIGIFEQPPRTPNVMRSLFRVVALGATNAIEYLIQTVTGGADYQVAEGDKKAQGDITWTEKTANVRTIAWFVKVSRQMLADVPYVASTIDDTLIYGVLKKEDAELLNGDGTTGHLLGLLPQAQALGGVTVGADIFDAVNAAIVQVGTNGYSATDIVMNPADWGALSVIKNGQGIYMLGGPQAVAGRTLWGLPITLTPTIAPATVLVGQFAATAAIFDRESATVDIAYENEDDFIRNLVCIRAEERLAFAVTAPAAYVKVVVPPVARTGGSGGLEHEKTRK